MVTHFRVLLGTLLILFSARVEIRGEPLLGGDAQRQAKA